VTLTQQHRLEAEIKSREGPVPPDSCRDIDLVKGAGGAGQVGGRDARSGSVFFLVSYLGRGLGSEEVFVKK